jgi:hypothetical protein
MNKPMRGEGADRAPVGLVRSVRAIAGTSGPSGIVVIANRCAWAVSYQPFPGLTER